MFRTDCCDALLDFVVIAMEQRLNEFLHIIALRRLFAVNRPYEVEFF